MLFLQLPNARRIQNTARMEESVLILQKVHDVNAESPGLENNVKQNHVNNYCSFCPYDIN
jgi:hypothetical protein